MEMDPAVWNLVILSSRIQFVYLFIREENRHIAKPFSHWDHSISKAQLNVQDNISQDRTCIASEIKELFAVDGDILEKFREYLVLRRL